jgi:hypothetical protein
MWRTSPNTVAGAPEIRILGQQGVDDALAEVHGQIGEKMLKNTRFSRWLSGANGSDAHILLPNFLRFWMDVSILLCITLFFLIIIQNLYARAQVFYMLCGVTSMLIIMSIEQMRFANALA